MHTKTLLTALFLFSMGSIVANEQIDKLMADMEQIKQQMVELQADSESQILKEQVAILSSRIQLLHEMTRGQAQAEIALMQTEFTKQLDQIKFEISSAQTWNSKAFEILITTLDSFQEKYTPEMMKAVAQEEKPQPQPAPMRPMKEERGMGCTTPYQAMNVGVRHNEARGVGYKKGYTTLEAFFTTDGWGDYTLPFLDLRGHVFNNGQLAGNAGIGFRSLLTSINHYWGMNVYYDVRHVSGLTVNQVGSGLELLGKRMEYRINTYFPVGKKSAKLGHAEFDAFEGNRLILSRRQKLALSGVDAEVGVHFLQDSSVWDLFAGGTPYYLWRSDRSAFGGKLRLKGAYKQYVALEVAGTYDHFFKATLQGSVALKYPFGPQPKRKGGGCSPSQMDDLLVARVTESPYRFEIPMIRNHHKRSSAINPFTGQPLTFWFVDNTSSSAGTFESPFPMLVQAQDASAPNDVIYVFQGDGTSNGMNQGIILKNNQILFGSGIDQKLLTGQGLVTIPAFTSGSPLITSTAGSVITLANGNTISGMDIMASVAGNAIDGLSMITGANIQHNTIFGNTNYWGVRILGSGTFNISNNTMTGLSSTQEGVSLTNLDAQDSQMTISNNTISGFASSIHVTPSTNPTTATGNLLVSGNNLSNFTQLGVAWTTGMAGSIVQIIDNTILNSVASGGFNDGIFVDLNNPGDAGRVIMNNNTIITTTTMANSRGIEAKILSARPDTSTQFEIAHNTILVGTVSGSTGILLEVAPFPQQLICASIFDNIIELDPSTPTFSSMFIQPNVGTIKIDNFNDNIAPNISIVPLGGGVVEFVPEGTCGFQNSSK